MPARQFNIDGVGDVSLHKRKGARAVRLSLAHDGTIRLSMPPWMPDNVGLEFVKQKRRWVTANRRPARPLYDGLRIGKAHTLRFIAANNASASSRIKGNDIVVSLPDDTDINNASTQRIAAKACVRALKKEAAALLPQRLAALAAKHGFSYKSVRIKQLKSRWGSCNHKREIVLNCYLMQLPWQQIDYVILHELTHTRILAHGRPFWEELGKYVDDLPAVRRLMRSQHPRLAAE